MKKIVGLVEKIKIIGGKEKEVLARMDTGAHKNSISTHLASELRLGPIIKTVRIKTSNGTEVRPVIEAKIIIKGKKIKTSFNITDRKHMKYSVLIGQDVLKKGFLIDPSKEK